MHQDGFHFGDHQKLAAGKCPHSDLKATPVSTLESPSGKHPTPPTINNSFQFDVQDLFDDEQ